MCFVFKVFRDLFCFGRKFRGWCLLVEVVFGGGCLGVLCEIILGCFSYDDRFGGRGWGFCSFIDFIFLDGSDGVYSLCICFRLGAVIDVELVFFWVVVVVGRSRLFF